VMPIMELGIPRHPDDDQVERYSMETMNASEAAKFEEHVPICETCQLRLGDTDAYVEAMRSAALIYRREQSSRRPATKPALARAGSPQ
jgi:hypothetical protein